jgi:enhancing lycopene biosynthesis protein 2
VARVAVVLSGCGYLDGAEVHESVITLLALDRAGPDAGIERLVAEVLRLA